MHHMLFLLLMILDSCKYGRTFKIVYFNLLLIVFITVIITVIVFILFTALPKLYVEVDSLKVHTNLSIDRCLVKSRLYSIYCTGPSCSKAG